jgi:hypothetical protein
MQLMLPQESPWVCLKKKGEKWYRCTMSFSVQLSTIDDTFNQLILNQLSRLARLDAEAGMKSLSIFFSGPWFSNRHLTYD